MVMFSVEITSPTFQSVTPSLRLMLATISAMCSRAGAVSEKTGSFFPSVSSRTRACPIRFSMP